MSQISFLSRHIFPPIVAYRLLIIAVCLSFSGCAVQPVANKGQILDTTVETAVRAVLEHGDWLVARGIHGPDNIIAVLTNMPLSHAAIYDAENNEVLEADGHGVHTASLDNYLERSTRVMVMSPQWASPETRKSAVVRARSHLGSGYNYTGLVGLDQPNSFYCTQLAIDAYLPEIRRHPPENPLPKVVKPGQMYHWGTIKYDSGPVLVKDKAEPEN